MRLPTKYVAALAGLALAGGVAVPTAASASASTGDREGHQQCAAALHAAVVEDNQAYATRDAARYEAALNPQVISVVDGRPTYGRDAVMAAARAAFATPGWTWSSTIKSETLFDCHSGAAVIEIRVDRVDGSAVTASATMMMVRYHDRFTTGMDTVHVLTRTPPTQG
jgi:hypothetical protein